MVISYSRVGGSAETFFPFSIFQIFFYHQLMLTMYEYVMTDLKTSFHYCQYQYQCWDCKKVLLILQESQSLSFPQKLQLSSTTTVFAFSNSSQSVTNCLSAFVLVCYRLVGGTYPALDCDASSCIDCWTEEITERRCSVTVLKTPYRASMLFTVIRFNDLP